MRHMWMTREIQGGPHRGREGTHCPICKEPVKTPVPNADVYCIECALETTKHLREKMKDGNK